MPKPHSLPIIRERTNIDAERLDGTLVVTFQGAIDQLAPGEFLDPLFEELHAQAMADATREVAIDFTRLQFLNSSGLRSVAKWLIRHHQVDVTKRYKVRVRYSDSLTWQRASIKTLASMVRGSFEAEVVH